MTDGPHIGEELAAEDQVVAEQLEATRPLPAPRFRGALARHLVGLDPHYGPRPQRLRLIVSGYLGAAALLLAIGSLQAMGAL